MNSIEAVYQNGVFKPIGEVGLRENQLVRLHVEPVEAAEAASWLKTVLQVQCTIVRRHGALPDSAPVIAADRMRDA